MNSPVYLSDLELSPGQATELYRLIGRALWACSFLEHQIVHHTILVFAGPFKSVEEVETALDKSFKQTMGNILKEFRKCCELAPNLDKRFDDLKSERDWLCHSIYRQGHLCLYKQDRLEILFKRLIQLDHEAKELASILNRNFDIWLAKRGVTEEQLHASVRETIKDWKGD